MSSERYEKGVARLKDMGCCSPIEEMVKEVSPDMAKYICEFAFGDIHSRPGLGKRERELVIMSSIATLGHAPLELKSHINMALNVGWTRKEVIEVFTQLCVYAGFPTAINAIFVAKEVFAERDKNGKAN